MSGIEDFMKAFGFTADALTIVIICSLVLMLNFAGGLFSQIILAFGGPIHERKMTQRTSFRLALLSELFLIVYIVYYHTVLVPGIEAAEIIYWAFILLAAPLLAAIGAQLIYIALADKIDGLKKEGRRIDRGEEAMEDEEGGPGEDGDEEEAEEAGGA